MELYEIKEKIISDTTLIPTLPIIVQKIIALLEDDTATARDLGELISYDQAVSARLLRVANSAYYGAMHEVATVRQAIVVLGFEEVKTLALGIGIINSVNHAADTCGFSPRAFWMHSAGCALAARTIRFKTERSDAGLYFTAGLMHDVGKIVLHLVLGDGYGCALEHGRRNGSSLIQAEQEVLGFTHAEIGAWLCERWKFPEQLVAAVGYHHSIGTAPPGVQGLCAAVHLADIVCKKAAIGSSGDTAPCRADSAALSELGIRDEELDGLVDEVLALKDKAETFVSAAA